ncbi:uncharacterized protein N7482_010748 [Penicillium canariense]|uniref:Uncharacterized protein n=1 Tax=Penicillium canariense TaxID=189055 RepID=A0A9W9HL82_9EURO|nr:uncharacterized protein N7482_010748 [Penicillium canariense]KAJ5151496.1 hypothetical protein N7482_010748 [Penicillium canariense]
MSFSADENQGATATPAEEIPVHKPPKAVANGGANDAVPADLLMALICLPTELQQLQEHAIMTMALHQSPPNRTGAAPTAILDRALMRYCISQQFRERLEEQAWYGRFQDETQGRNRCEHLATRLQDLANMVAVPIPENIIRLRLINGSRPELKAKWLQEREPPKSLADTIDPFCQLERGISLAKEPQTDPHAMELSAIDNHQCPGWRIPPVRM